ncbi:Golgi SNAP receptor complex member 1 isoform X2 [Podarcis raffonei]|uniref:Golgi SNAP receptor complex member 1 isoform X2 n=1 Tax=Podarcis raffonei TaxID=65483 RepID=UPI00232947F6|nr:Golgi SNAP receptor complex member 1 isoform X2 [Podarcis raffonei]
MAAAGGSSNYWEDLRKQARQLENELDLKLVSFSKLCTSYSHSSSREGRRDSSDTTPLLNGSSQDRMFETMAVEIEQLLGKLTGINDKMAEYTNSAGVPSLNAALMHTLQRHRDILQDYTHEFHKTKTNFLAVRERENLMGSVRKDIESYKSGCGVNNRRTELFLKEHEHLRNSDRLVEETIRKASGSLPPPPRPAEARGALAAAFAASEPEMYLTLALGSGPSHLHGWLAGRRGGSIGLLLQAPKPSPAQIRGRSVAQGKNHSSGQKRLCVSWAENGSSLAQGNPFQLRATFCPGQPSEGHMPVMGGARRGSRWSNRCKSCNSSVGWFLHTHLPLSWKRAIAFQVQSAASTKFKLAPAWNPGELLPASVDNSELDGPSNFTQYKAASYDSILHLQKSEASVNFLL